MSKGLGLEQLPVGLPDSQEGSEALRGVLRQYWGYEGFLPLQEAAMSRVLAGQDSVVVLPTGGGKSLCFQAPALCLDGLALVVSPLISLMKDQVDALRSCGIPAAFANSSLSGPERLQVAEQIRRRELKLLYVAPERLLLDRTLDFLQAAGVSLVAIDEAHCISSWGHDFRPEYRGLKVLRQAFPGVGIHAYTATASERVRQDIVAQLELRDPAMLVGNFDRPNLIYRITRTENRFGDVVAILNRHRGESGIVYCISRKEVERTAASLNELGFRAAPYHAGLTDEARRTNQEAFILEQVEIIVATVAFGMGIDKSNVRFVVHAGMPKSLEHYQQESGRAGRDGLEAECSLLFNGSDPVIWRKILEDTEPVARESALQALDAMQAFCVSAACRHRALVQHFGQDFEPANCRACDVCLGEVEHVEDATTIGQKILSCVLRLEERYGATHTTKVLVGSREQRLLDAGHDGLSTYGLLSDEPPATIRYWIDQLVGQGFLRVESEFKSLRVTPEGRRLLKREATPSLSRPRQTGRSAAQADLWEGVDRGLFEELRALRAEQAAARNVPAYVIFGDGPLRDMARRRPSTVDAFRAIRGVGAQKLTDYGELFVQRINDYCGRQALAQDVELPAVGGQPQAAPAPRFRTSSAAAFPFFRAGAGLDEVGQRLQRARSTVIQYLSDFLTAEGVTDVSPWVASETVSRVEAACREVGTERLKPIFEHCQGEVQYDDIRLVVICLANRG